MRHSKDGTTCTLTEIVDPTAEFTVPEKINLKGKIYAVTEIAENAIWIYTHRAKFGSVMSRSTKTSPNRTLRKITLPNTLRTIKANAFCYCQQLVDVVLPPSLEYIEPDAFLGCNKLLTNQDFMARLAAFAEKNGDDMATYFGETWVQPNVAATQYLMANVPSTPAMSSPQQAGNATATLATPALKEPSSDIDVNIPQADKENENLFAFVIANENYRNVSTVKYALNDGKAMAKYSKQALGVPEDNIKTYYDATLNDINSAMRTMKQIAEAYNGEASFIVYYAGHGIPDEANGTSYLLPIDGDGADFETGYSLKKFYERISGIPAKNVVVFMDACFSGSQRGDGMLVAARGVAIKAKAEAPKGNMVVISAAQGDETAYPYAEKEHGMFTYFLLKKLQEDKGATSLGNLSTYVTEQVSRRSIVKNNKSQTPSTQASAAIGEAWKEWMLK